MRHGAKAIHRGLIVLEAAALLGLVMFIFCTSKRPVRDDVRFSELSEAVLAAVRQEEGYQLSDSAGLRKYYGLDANAYEGVLLYLPASNMDAAELLLVVMQEESQAQALEAAMNERLEQQKKVFESYGVEQMGILNRAVICVEGRYGLFAVCQDADAAREAFENVIAR